MTGVLWSQEEDDELRRLVEVHGAKAWSKIAKDLGSKGSKQCRRRWKNFLNMNAKTCGWSAEEDEQLIEAHRRHGNKWTEISRILGDRTDNAVKNRWAALVKKNPRLADDDSSGTATAPPAKRQRMGEGTTTTTSGYNPYSSGPLQHAQPHYGPVLGHFQGQPLSAMPTPFDQHLLIQPQQHHQLMSAQMQQQAHAHAALAPLSIVVNKGLLTAQELALVQQINQAHAPVHIEVAERPVGADAGSGGSDPLVDVRDVTRRPSWHQFMDSLDTEPQPSNLSDILNWFNSGGAQQQQQQQQNPQLPPGRRLTRSLSRQGGSGGGGGSGGTGAPNRSESLTDAHRHLLVRLISKGLEARTASEQAELDMLGLASVTAMDNHVNDFTAGAAAAAAGTVGPGGGAGAVGTRAAGIHPMPAGWGAGPAAAAAGAAAAVGASPGAADVGRRGSGGARMDPLRRTRSSQRREAEAAAAAGAGLGGDHLLHTGFPGFLASGNLAAAAAAAVAGAAPAPAPAAGGGGGGGPAALTRRMSSFRGRDGMPQINPNELFGDVLLTPTFTSQEIAMLLDALTPAAGGGKGH